ncbi:hypothetical protein CPB85DRAFT_1436391 [Mucidula mucida]|nr:hypothetical protein CPB85DRAFT_1436391 [Mucidula mucida]
MADFDEYFADYAVRSKPRPEHLVDEILHYQDYQKGLVRRPFPSIITDAGRLQMQRQFKAAETDDETPTPPIKSGPTSLDRRAVYERKHRAERNTKKREERALKRAQRDSTMHEEDRGQARFREERYCVRNQQPLRIKMAIRRHANAPPSQPLVGRERALTRPEDYCIPRRTPYPDKEGVPMFCEIMDNPL